MKRIGIYPGTFDPIHAGHIAFAQEAMRTCKLDEVIFLPEHSPRYKTGVTDIIHRTALIRLATQDMPQLSVEILSSLQFSVKDTLQELRALRSNARLTLLVGSDVAQTLSSWQNVNTLLRDLSLVIGIREGDGEKALARELRNLANDQITFVTTRHASVSSSAIRNGHIISDTLHLDARNYIQQRSLYG